MQTSSGKCEWFRHQRLMFSCLRTYRAQNLILSCPAAFSNMLFFSQCFKQLFLSHVCQVSCNFTSCLNSGLTASTDFFFQYSYVSSAVWDDAIWYDITASHDSPPSQEQLQEFSLSEEVQTVSLLFDKLFPITYCILLTVINFIMVTRFQIKIQMEQYINN